jgi:hypothetical protein
LTLRWLHENDMNEQDYARTILIIEAMCAVLAAMAVLSIVRSIYRRFKKRPSDPP